MPAAGTRIAALLRAELGNWYPRAYGLARDELRYILDPADVKGPDSPSKPSASVMRLNSGIQPPDRLDTIRSQRRKIAADDRPQIVSPNDIVFVPEQVAEPADFFPWLVRRQQFGLFAELSRGLADPAEAALDRIDDEIVRRE